MPSCMRTKPIIAGAVGFVLLLFVAILFVAARSAPSPITVRNIKSVPFGGAIKMTFEITNHTTTIYSLVLVCIEVHDGPVWRKCSDFDAFGQETFSALTVLRPLPFSQPISRPVILFG